MALCTLKTSLAELQAEAESAHRSGDTARLDIAIRLVDLLGFLEWRTSASRTWRLLIAVGLNLGRLVRWVDR